MKRAAGTLARVFGAACLLILAAGVVAPRIGADRYREQIREALQKALGRQVEVGGIHFNVFTGVGFAVDNVVIHEDPSIGIEPVAYVTSLEAVPRLWSLFSRRLEFASIRLDDASINLTKTGAPSEPGRWNFAPLLSRSLIYAFPEIHVRGGRINFTFGDTKSALYLTDTDLDISPPTRAGGDWSVKFSGAPARTDRPARGFGQFTASGRWRPARAGHPDGLDLDLVLEKSMVGEMITLLHGEGVGIHGVVSSRLRLRGPLDNIRINGRVMVEDVHRWDLVPPSGQGWPFGVEGRLNLAAQTLDLESSTAEQQELPVSVRFRLADYLSQPHWSVAVNWNHFPLGPVTDLARHMGAPLPPRLQLAGTIDGALVYDGHLRGELAFRDTAVTIPDTPPIRFERARMVFEGPQTRLIPAVVRLSNEEQAQLEAVYDWGTQALEIGISTGSMNVAALRSQVALAAVPWLDRLAAGVWKGELHYRWDPRPEASQPGWSGEIELAGAELPLAGLAQPLVIETARVAIDGPRLALDRLRGRVGKVPVEGEYRYDPRLARPHRFRLAIAQVDAAEVERQLMPALARGRRGLLGRALGFGPVQVPEWMTDRRMEGTLQIGSLVLGGTRVEKVRAMVVWDGMRVRLQNISGRMEEGALSGALTANLRGAKPAYLFSGRLKAASVKSGKVDVEGIVETHGTGLELLSNLRSEGAFAGRGLEVGSLPPLKTVGGTYLLTWATPEPRLGFQKLELETADGVYAGRGATQDDGRLLIELTSGTKEMRMSGTLAKLRMEEPVAP